VFLLVVFDAAECSLNENFFPNIIISRSAYCRTPLLTPLLGHDDRTLSLNEATLPTHLFSGAVNYSGQRLRIFWYFSL
jgi:hypothetical protein